VISQDELAQVADAVDQTLTQPVAVTSVEDA
jgi:hypothetical protein